MANQINLMLCFSCGLALQCFNAKSIASSS